MIQKVSCALVLFAAAVYAQSPASGRLFEQNCMTCHGKLAGAPATAALRQMPETTILNALSTGAAHEKTRMTGEQQRDLAEYLTGKNLVPAALADAKQMPNVCRNNAPITDLSAAPAWNG